MRLKILNFLLILILISLSFTNQKIFSIGMVNLIPLRVFILAFIAATFFISRGKAFLDKKLWKDKIFIALLLLLIIRLLSLIPAVDKKDALFLNLYFISIVLFYLSSRWLFHRVRNIKVYLNVYIISAFIGAVFGLIQALYFVVLGISYWDIWSWQYPTGFRIPGLMLDSNHYAMFLLSAIFLILSFSFETKRFREIIKYIVIFTAFILASSRSALAAFMLSFGTLAVRSFFLRKRRFLGLAVILFVLGLFLGFSTNKGLEMYTQKYVKENFIIHEEVTSEEVQLKKKTPEGNLSVHSLLWGGPINTGGTSQEGYLAYDLEESESSDFGISFLAKFLPNRVWRVFDASARSHLAMLKAGLFLGLNNPLLGVGYGNFAEALKTSPYIDLLKAEDPRGASQEDFPSHTHWGGVMAETGMLGFFTYLGLVLLIGCRLLRKRDFIGISIFSSFLAFQVFGIFYHLNEEFYWIFIFLGLEYSRQGRSQTELSYK